MNWSEFLFSFSGRVSRSGYWLMALLTLPAAIVAGMINSHFGHDPVRTGGPGILVLLPFIWSNLAVVIKRWHDRDKSGWWILINLIPVIGGIWAFVENGFLKGTDGSNRYGPDPLERTG
jgi:uncharacterized membrane protein YhaH (DUF805 family)